MPAALVLADKGDARAAAPSPKLDANSYVARAKALSARSHAASPVARTACPLPSAETRTA